MHSAIFTSVVSFISTNLDDIFVLMLLYAQAQTPKARHSILIGQYLGAAILMTVCLAAAFGVGLLPGTYLRMLGFVPILLGLRAWRNRKADDNDRVGNLGVVSVMLFALANGTDNIGIYIPLFAGEAPEALAVFLAVYALLLPFWCALARRLTQLPLLGEKLQKYKGILVPVVFILLGLYILVK